LSFIIFEKYKIMKGIIAIIFTITWAIVFFGYAVRGVIHLFLVIAFTAIILRIIQGNKPV